MSTLKYIGIRFPGYDENYISLNSHTSLSDADAAVFAPDLDDVLHNYDSVVMMTGC